MSDIYAKMVKEALAAQYADVNVLKAKRGTKFTLSDAKPYVDAVTQMAVADDQSAAVINLHKASVKAHFEVLSGLTGYVRPENDPFVEHYQTPAILEILCDEDKKFDRSLETFANSQEEREHRWP